MSTEHKRSYVYFIRARESGRVKIGRSNKLNIQARMRSFQTGSPELLTVLGWVPETRTLTEQRLHQQFSHLRLHYEWFAPGEEFLMFLDELPLLPSTGAWQTSRFLGVLWVPKMHQWAASVKHAGKGVHLGLFDLEHKAAQEYDRARLWLSGPEYRYFNLLVDMPVPRGT